MACPQNSGFLFVQVARFITQVQCESLNLRSYRLDLADWQPGVQNRNTTARQSLAARLGHTLPPPGHMVGKQHRVSVDAKSVY